MILIDTGDCRYLLFHEFSNLLVGIEFLVVGNDQLRTIGFYESPLMYAIYPINFLTDSREGSKKLLL